MTTSSTELIVIPKRFCGLRVLLVEPEESSLEHHANILLQNSYHVTTTTKAAGALSKILNGNIPYDCVLIDADISDMDMVDFLHQTFMHHPHLSIVMMASDININMPFFKETLTNEAVLCIPKPCAPTDICNIWQHVCRKVILLEKGDDSNGKSPEENQEPNIFERVNAMFNRSTTLNSLMINNNESSGNSTQEHGAMFKSVTNEELLSDDRDQEHVDQTSVKENISSATMKIVDKGKQPVEYKRTYDQLEDDRYTKKNKKRIAWTNELHRKFLDALDKLGKQKAWPTTILEEMKVPGLTRSQVASHLQKYQEHLKNNKQPTLLQHMQRENKLLVQSYGQSTPSDNNAITLPSSIPQPTLTLNSGGTSFMTINNIKARLQGALPLFAPQPTTTINISDSDQSTDYTFGNLFQPSIGDTSMISTYGLGENSNSASQGNDVQMTGYGYRNVMGMQDVNETLAMAPMDVGAVVPPLHCSNTAIEPWVTTTPPVDYGLQTALQPLGGVAVGGENYNPEMSQISNYFGVNNSSGGGTASSSNQGLEHLAMHEFVGGDIGLLQAQDFHGNGENLFPSFPHSTTLDDVETSIYPNFSNSNSVPFRGESVGFSNPSFPAEENNRRIQIQPPLNSIVTMDGFEGRVIEGDFFGNESQFNLEMTMNLLEGLDAHLINGPW